MTRTSGYALLAAVTAAVVAICAAIVLGVGTGGGAAVEAARPHTSATAATGAAPAEPADSGDWVGTWATAPTAAEPGTPNGLPGLSVRNVVHASAGGTAARVVLSNLFGTVPLVLTHVTLGVAAGPGDPDAVPGAITTLTFGGRDAISIPIGHDVTSDAVRLRVPAESDLLISTYTPYASGPVTFHPHARQTSYVARGDHTGDTDGTAFTGQDPYWRYVTGVDVWTDDARGSVVTLGDSITDGMTSTMGANHRWPDYLAERLQASRNGPRLGVLNEGISGNRLLTNAPAGTLWGPNTLSRLDRDALSAPGVRTLVVDIGINDILEAPQRSTAAQIVAGLRQITREAHAHGVRVVGATLTPFGGHVGWTARLNLEREQVNAAIRAGHVYDAYVDFDQALRDPAAPYRLLPRYDSGDHLHPSDAGYRAMADAVPLPLLTGPAPAGV
ncbi:SGNH/GDSL hydrolase family protein [Streptomyces sp. SL13]|uniref:SGNH/GDSL hydrolase family protein n=1 Tax=Streptantibioticus silvisoli TaxID=2705255 RepID=A0AA90H1U7_9ACTN|nr:SGNH/GDSL hydrolase family protein [Streptantibioticus silvisoli]MDI5966801.1 SGNH/GDSL hydrolase family protein [Streptantibioticus silvisoli]MDI5972498.1 SGNH/GDSL hydrolase family protein [Streptantibioticus silvisoli]